MSVISKIKQKGQLTVPKEIMEQFNLSVGDVLEFSVGEGEIKLRPVKVMAIPKDEVWGWQPEVMSAMKETDQLYAEGKLKLYTEEQLADLFADLDAD
ncbi:MAG: AbrB/MazE/SpoVT family DNA-binding domain-containing protein [Dethiobacter sp.]|jgi:AbrB family looped-hinge helix DNA binding protein|nr:AbrB/MazE/SpoVT family DNA-binding domain-containing protein [Dethiobacter sp.]MCL4464156.1 AbrB/MazE/SpoVT family DNA-binding domain-containing protein [Bacillota bacterium]MCL5992718.1 AbrB/MazE/SpoVT family DNA-binding domain-containing protein [Bacillota bacterium]